MEIRDAGETDLDLIAGVHVDNQRQTYRGLLPDEYLRGLSPAGSRRKWARHLAEEGCALWTAWEGDCFLGFAAGKPDGELDGTWYLDSLHVAAEARGRGVGTALIRAAGQYARAHGYGCMSVCIVRGNQPARRLYRSLGARHLKDFDDQFQENTVSHSEKLLWEDLAVLG